MEILRFLCCLVALSVVETRTSGHFRKISKLVTGLNPNHVTLFTNNTLSSVKFMDSFFPEISGQTPTNLIDVSDIKNLTLDAPKKMPFFLNPRKSTTYIFYFGKDYDVHNVYSILDDLAKISPIPMRPKCLLAILDKDHRFDNLKNILRYAWSLKFLDFTTMRLDEDESKIVYTNFNPFTNVYTTRYLRNAKKVFPDKLNDVQKFPLNIPIYQYEPYVTFENKSGVLETGGVYSEYMKIMAKKMNFKIRYIIQNNMTFKEIFLNLEKEKFNLMPSPFYVAPHVNKKNHLDSFVIDVTKLAVVVPVRKISRIYFSFEIFVYIISFPLIISIFILFAKIFKFNSQVWSPLYILRVFIGVPSSSPRRRIENHIFLLLALLSVIYSNIFFSKFEEMKVISEEENFHSIEELLKSEMKVYSVYSAHKNDIEIIKNLFMQGEKIKNNADCIQILIKTRFAACILSYLRAKYFSRINKDDHGMPIMKVTKLVVRKEFSAFSYEKASPYAEKFDRVLQQIIECGFLKNRVKYNNVDSYYDENTEATDDVLVEELVFITIVGWLLALIVFLREKLWISFQR